MNYTKIWQSETEYKIQQDRDDGIHRWVDEDYHGYVQWLADGNPVDEVEYVAPEPSPDPGPEPLSLEERMAALEMAMLEVSEAIL